MQIKKRPPTSYSGRHCIVPSRFPSKNEGFIIQLLVILADSPEPQHPLRTVTAKESQFGQSHGSVLGVLYPIIDKLCI